MTSTWKLSDAFYLVFHRWPLVVLFLLAGGLVGWGIGYLTPARYRAETQVYVAFNAYRAKDDSQFLALARPKYTNIDDYKNWQMAQLDAFLSLDGVLQPVLDSLRQQDTFWQAVTVEQLREMLSSEWRNPGSWSLVAEVRQAKLAEQAAHTWSEIAVELIQESASASYQAILLDEQIAAFSTEQARVESSKQELLAIQVALQDWLQQAENLEQEQPLPSDARLLLVDLAAQAVSSRPGIAQSIESLPDAQAPARQAVAWVEEFMAIMQSNINLLADTSARLDLQRETLADEYAQVYPMSRGLSANLEIQQVQDHTAQQIQSNALLALVGSAIGLCAWALTAIYELYRGGGKPQ